MKEPQVLFSPVLACALVRKKRSGLKPRFCWLFMARLKSCPDTKQTATKGSATLPSERLPVQPLGLLFGERNGVDFEGAWVFVL